MKESLKTGLRTKDLNLFSFNFDWFTASSFGSSFDSFKRSAGIVYISEILPSTKKILI